MNDKYYLYQLRSRAVTDEPSAYRIAMKKYKLFYLTLFYFTSHKSIGMAGIQFVQEP